MIVCKHKDTHTHTHTHVQMQMYICTGVRVYICIKLWIINMQQFTSIFPQNEFPVRRHNSNLLQCFHIMSSQCVVTTVHVYWMLKSNDLCANLSMWLFYSAIFWCPQVIGPIQWAHGGISISSHFSKKIVGAVFWVLPYPPKCRRTFLKNSLLVHFFGFCNTPLAQRRHKDAHKWVCVSLHWHL